MVRSDLEQIFKLAQKTDSVCKPIEVVQIHGNRVHPVGFRVAQFTVDLDRIIVVPEIDGVICAIRGVDRTDDFREIIDGRRYLRIGIDGNIASTHARAEPTEAEAAGQERGPQIIRRVVDANDLHIVELDQKGVSLGRDFQVVCASGSDAGYRVLDEIGPAIIFAPDLELVPANVESDVITGQSIKTTGRRVGYMHDETCIAGIARGR